MYSPAIVSDGTVSISNALVDYLKIPVLTTNRSKGTISHNHKCSLGGSQCLKDEKILQILQQADTVFILGCSPSEFSEFESILEKDIRIIQVDIDPEYIGFDRRIEVAIVGNTQSVLQDMLQYIKKSTSQNTPWLLPIPFIGKM